MTKTIVLTILFLGLPGAVCPDTGASIATRVHFTLIDCVGNYGKSNMVRYSVLDSQSGEPVREGVLPTAAYALTREWDVMLPSGFYRILVDVGDCDDSLLVPVLANEERNIVAFLRNGIVMRTSQAMIAGTLPIKGYVARIVFASSAKPTEAAKLIAYNAVVSGNAFYATGLPNGSASLEISNSNFLPGSVLRFPIGLVTTSGSRSRIVFNVTMDDLANAVHREPF